MPQLLMKQGRKSFPFKSATYYPIILGSRGFVPTQTLNHLQAIFGGSEKAKDLAMTAARECAKEAIIGSIQIARNASVPVFTPFPHEPVYLRLLSRQ